MSDNTKEALMHASFTAPTNPVNDPRVPLTPAAAAASHATPLDVPVAPAPVFEDAPEATAVAGRTVDMLVPDYAPAVPSEPIYRITSDQVAVADARRPGSVVISVVGSSGEISTVDLQLDRSPADHGKVQAALAEIIERSRQ